VSKQVEVKTCAWGVLRLRDAMQRETAPTRDGGFVFATEWSSDDHDHFDDVSDATKAAMWRVHNTALREFDKASKAIQSSAENRANDPEDKRSPAERLDEFNDAMLDEQERVNAAYAADELFVGSGVSLLLDAKTVEWIKPRVEKLRLRPELGKARAALLAALGGAKAPEAK
jgi:hypothetical protein